MDELWNQSIGKSSMYKYGNYIWLFTPGKPGYSVYSLETGIISSKATVRPIRNISFTGRWITIFYKDIHDDFDPVSLRCVQTIVKEGVDYKFQLGSNCVYYILDKRMLKFYKNRFVSEETILCVSFVLSSDTLTPPFGLFCVQTSEEIRFYGQRGIIHSLKKMVSSPVKLGLRNGKFYILDGKRLMGHDLNIYMDGLAEFAPTMFTNIENEVFLYDGSRKELRLYSKTLGEPLFQISADSYNYDNAAGHLIVIYKGELRGFVRRNIYAQPFKLVEGCTRYIEQEDEFDESDNAFVDIFYGQNGYKTAHEPAGKQA